MEKQINPIANSLIWLIAGIMLAVLMASMFSSCKSSKTLFSSKTDSSIVSKTDSGGVTKTTNTDLKKDDWWKETIIYPAKDCTVNINYITPAVVYREGGSTTKVIDNTRYDSGWKNKFDSLHYLQEIGSKKKKTELLGFWHIVGISAGVGVVFLILSKFKISFR